ncbi:sensor histidine kinase [Nitriliruptor alkaliphilus]|uniref:sensor histidine kinase n=1 Tax=Nitriliruptor alkaliphilus TaxID=427918 RepID=UPI0006967454|nr:sensor histidine kinase [Nitriliruptor alkaliphilus]
MDTTTTPTSPAAQLARWVLRGRSPARVAAVTGHLLLDLPFGILSFVVVAVLVPLGAGLLIVYPLALPALGAFVVVAHGLAALERGRVRAFLDIAIEDPPPMPTEGSWHTRLWAALQHPRTWRSAAYHLLRLPVGVVAFTLTVVAWALVIGLLTLPLAVIDTPVGAIPLRLWAGLLLGPPLAIVLVPVVVELLDAVADLDAALTAALLGSAPAEVRERRIERLSGSRSDLVDAAEQERRRIERDLHDGAGQQLVSLAMTLGMAREKLRHDPAEAQALLDEAHAGAKQALVGLREIVRGISPAILADRGLGPALSAVTARAALPVSLDVQVAVRPDPVTEGIAYYVVCEALSNAVRHAGASRVEVTVVREDDRLELTVRDDGRGGADPARGTGLHGLAARVGAVDGDLEVDSPRGGPTTLRASLPIRPAAETTASVGG